MSPPTQKMATDANPNPEKPEAHTTSPGTESRRGLDIFVCDESAPMRAVVHELLTLDGHRVESFESGRRLWERVGAGRPDLLIVELHMPDMTAFELLGMLQDIGFNGQIILMTGVPDPALAKKCMQWNAHVCLEKPFAFRILRTIVSHLRRVPLQGA